MDIYEFTIRTGYGSFLSIKAKCGKVDCYFFVQDDFWVRMSPETMLSAIEYFKGKTKECESHRIGKYTLTDRFVLIAELYNYYISKEGAEELAACIMECYTYVSLFPEQTNQ